MNKRSSFPLALAMIALSAAHTTASACFRTDFADSNLLGNNYIGDGNDEGGGDKAAVDTSMAGTGASTEEQQQSQQQAQADGAPQADSDVKVDADPAAGEAKAVGDPPAGTDQQT